MLNNIEMKIDGKNEIVPMTVILYRARGFSGTPTLLNQTRFVDLAWFNKDKIQNDESVLRGSSQAHKACVLCEFDRVYKDDNK